MTKPKPSKPPLWFRILIDTPAVVARICGAFLAMSFIVPDEVASHFSWLHRLDADISVWFFVEFVVRTTVIKPWRSYALSADGVLNLLAALPPTGLVPLEAVRHAARFLMAASAKLFREAIQEVANAVRRVVAENRQSLVNMLTLVMVCTIAGAIIISVLEQDIARPMAWAFNTVLPFVDLPAEYSPTTASGHILESLLTLVRYAALTWLGALTLKTWRLAVGDTPAGSKNESD